MAIAVTLDFKGGTIAQYDEVIRKMGLTPEGPTPPGALFHWVSASGDGLHVTDVWETREAFDSFAAEQIGPYSQEVGLPEPSTTFYEVHNYFIKR
jgi:hypothetical protein